MQTKTEHQTSANSTTKTTSRKRAPKKRRAAMVDHPKRPSIKPGSTFDTLEAVLAKLGVTIRVEDFTTYARFASYAQWQASMLTGGMYSMTQRVLTVPPGPGRRAALEWGIGCVTVADHDLGSTMRPDFCRKVFEYLQLEIINMPPVIDELPNYFREDDYTDEDLEFLRSHVAAGHVEVVQVNPITQDILDPEDRQETVVMWDARRQVLLIVLAVEVDDEDRSHLRERYGVELDKLPVTVHGSDEVHLQEATRARDQLREWRATHPAPDAAAVTAAEHRALDEATATARMTRKVA